MISRILLFGDTSGLPQLLRTVPHEMVVALVGAKIRPHQHPELEKIVEEFGLSFIIQPKRSSKAYPGFVNVCRDLAPDLIMVNSYSMRIPQEILDIPFAGGVNIHGGLLPQYRGANPIQWAILNNERETGVTMHYMTSDFDAGDLIAQRNVPILLEDTWIDVRDRIMSATESMLAETIPKLLKMTNTRRPQDETRAKYYRRRRPKDGNFDWEKSVLYIYNLVRALVKPLPGAFYYDGDVKIVLDEYIPLPVIAAMKYDPQIGGQELKGECVTLRPLSQEVLNLEGPIPEAKIEPGYCERGNVRSEILLFQNDLLDFSIHLLENDVIIGRCKTQNIDYSSNKMELHIDTLERHRLDDSCIAEIISLLLGFGFDELELSKVHVLVQNDDIMKMLVFNKSSINHEYFQYNKYLIKNALSEALIYDAPRELGHVSKKSNTID
jgi:methionyl-tRNA formyltransferase